jgi:hypothetical protein
VQIEVYDHVGDNFNWSAIQERGGVLPLKYGLLSGFDEQWMSSDELNFPHAADFVDGDLKLDCPLHTCGERNGWIDRLDLLDKICFG